IHNCCLPNALLTLAEYTIDYSDDEFKKLAVKVIDEQMENITNEKARSKAKDYYELIKQGQRDFRF
ncbi:MAG: [FeFe] hydrogenase H-cluster radical SAM maturase HydG, partial [Oscillospiraceae bacterium]